VSETVDSTGTEKRHKAQPVPSTKKRPYYSKEQRKVMDFVAQMMSSSTALDEVEVVSKENSCTPPSPYSIRTRQQYRHVTPVFVFTHCDYVTLISFCSFRMQPSIV